MPKILVASLPVEGILSSTEAASLLTRLLRAHDRSLTSDAIVQLPLVDGGEGTIDFLVTHTLGSFLEVEATGARGDVVVVPLGFASEDGKLAVIEMQRVAGVGRIGDGGTTYGVGELIRDSLDEGAFSVLLGHDEPLACDAGLGAAAALGVKFLDASGKPLAMERPGVALADIASIDVSGRSFELLSSRFFIGRTPRANESKPSDDLLAPLEQMAQILLRDAGIHASTEGLSASAIEFGLRAFLGAEVSDGGVLALEASRIGGTIDSGDFDSFILFADRPEQLRREEIKQLLNRVSAHVKHTVIIFNSRLTQDDIELLKNQASAVHSLQDVVLFQQPLADGASAETVRRDLLMRLEKLMPTLLPEPVASPKREKHV
jgi:hypothetical protein